MIDKVTEFLFEVMSMFKIVVMVVHVSEYTKSH